MEFNYIKDKVLETWKFYFHVFSINKCHDYEIIKLQEEVWELSQSYLIWKWQSKPKKRDWKTDEELKDNIAMELADVIWTSILLANTLWIDLEQAISKKWFDRN